MKRIIILVLALLWTVSAKAQFFEGFSVINYKITSAVPTSFRSAKGSVFVTVGNTGDTRKMSGITATVYRNGRRFANGTCDNVTIFKGTNGYTLNGRVQLADGVSTWDLIKAAFSFRASEYTLDFTVSITHPDGKTDYVVRSREPLTKYLRRR